MADSAVSQGRVAPAFLSHVVDAHDAYGSDADVLTPTKVVDDTLDLSGPGWEAPPSSTISNALLRTVLTTYRAHATCGLQATRGLKHYIAKLEELVVQMGVPAAWEVSSATVARDGASTRRLAPCTRRS